LPSGWSNGYKEWIASWPLALPIRQPFVSVSYRKLPNARHPVPLDDTVAALSFLVTLGMVEARHGSSSAAIQPAVTSVHWQRSGA
jgi:hypothetical protein